MVTMIARATLSSVSPYGANRQFAPKEDRKESHDDYEKRMWRERGHYTEKGQMFIPPMAFKSCVADAAGYLGEKIPGQRNATWKKHFVAGIIVIEPLLLPETRETVQGVWVNVPSDGKKGGKTRVPKCFPVVPSWSGVVEFFILDSIIRAEPFDRFLQEAGNFIGIGAWRVQNGGMYGRFKVEKIEWREKT